MKIACIRPLLLVSILAAGLLTAGSAFADFDPVLLNGGFEDPVQAPNTSTDITQGGLTGWTGATVTGAQESLVNGNVPNIFGQPYGTTPFGEQYLGLRGFFRGGIRSVESQATGNFVAGQTYEFGVYFSNVGGATGPSLEIDVVDGPDGTGTLIQSVTFESQDVGPYGDGPIDFTLATVDFTAISTGSVNFSLINNSAGALALDNASIKVLGVPEPSTWLLLAVGGGALLLWARRAGGRSLAA